MYYHVPALYYGPYWKDPFKEGHNVGKGFGIYGHGYLFVPGDGRTHVDFNIVPARDVLKDVAKAVPVEYQRGIMPFAKCL